MNDYKSDMDMDMHKPMNSLDTDYRPNYDGRINTINSIFIIFHTNFILGLPLRKDNEISMSNVTPTSYDDLRIRNRQDYDRTQPNKMAYR